VARAGTHTRSEALQAADALLDRRANPQWSSMSWTTLRPLISSINQLLIGASPTLVAHLRQYWAQRMTPSVDLRVVDQSEADTFVLLGDPGEQDRSQYIVVPALRRVVEREQPAFGVICSDVIYPSGDVNDYVHGFYLPYGPVPPANAPAAVDGRTARGPSRLEQLPFFALPGNHDWHDGLSGFMQHFCGTGGLELRQLGWPQELSGIGPQWLEAVRRMLLRRPDRFREQPLWLGPPGTPHTESLDLDGFRALRGPRPRQPGSYFAIRLRDLTVVAIDTGIGLGKGESAIDSHQGYWLEQVSALPGPKLLLTGNPLLVNAERHTCAIDPPEPGWHGERPAHRSVNQIVDDPAFGYVAVIGGDIHNFQHYVVEQPMAPPRAGSRVVHHVVSGGGGAYMSATHPVRVVQQIRRAEAGGELPPVISATPPSEGRDSPRTPHAGDLPDTMAPTPVESLQHFTRLLLPRLWRLERALLTAVAGIAAGGVAAATAPDPGLFLIVSAAVLVAAAVARVSVPSQRLRRPAFPMGLYRAALVAVSFVIGVALASAVSWLDPAQASRTLVGWAWLTAAGALVGWLMRRTGWWRDPRWPQERLKPATVPLVAVAGVGSVASAAAFGWWAVPNRSVQTLPATVGGLPSDLLWLVPALVVTVIGLVAVLAFVRLRPSGPGGKVWGRWAPPVSYLVQLAAAVLVLTYTVFPHRPTLPWAVVCGVLVFPLTILAGLAIAAVLLRLACLPAGARSAQRWGEWGRFGQQGIGLAVVVLLGLQLLVSGDAGWAARIRPALLVPAALAVLVALVLVHLWRRRRVAEGSGEACGNGAILLGTAAAALVAAVSEIGFATTTTAATLLSTYRAQLGTQLTLITVVLMAFLIDALRRMSRGRHGYKVTSVLAVALLALLIWAIDQRLGWVLRSAVASLVVIMLVVITLSLVHLAYLGAYTLLRDRQAHRDGQELLTARQARQFLDWRVTPQDETKRLHGLAHHRAKIVFPSTDEPQGPIQRYVAEIFDSDAPPFVKNFLLLRTGQGRLTIQVFVVRGTSTIEADARPMMEIVVPLSAGPGMTAPAD